MNTLNYCNYGHYTKNEVRLLENLEGIKAFCCFPCYSEHIALFGYVLWKKSIIVSKSKHFLVKKGD